MGRASLKSHEPIPLPHDGPLHQQLNSEEKKANDAVLETALEALQQKDSPNSSPSFSLLKTLQDAKNIKEQLHALQTFRSNSLQQKKRKHATDDGTQTPAATPPEEEDPLHKSALFRVLLEWFLSIQTPMPLRRAIQANLDGMLVASNENACLRQVLNSVLAMHQDASLASWQKPLHSLHESLNYKATHDLLLHKSAHGQDQVLKVLLFLQHYAVHHLQPTLRNTLLDPTNSSSSNNSSEAVFFVEEKVTIALQQSVQWAGIVKTVLADAPSMAIGGSGHVAIGDDLLAYMESFLWQLLTCRIVPVDALSKLGMAYGRVLLLRNPPVPPTDDAPGSLAQHIDHLTTQQLSDLTAIAMVQGLAATAPIPIMLQESQTLLDYFQQESNQADPGVRLAALKGIHTLMSRCLTRITSEDEPELTALERQAMQSTSSKTLEIVLQAWENPPNRRLGNAIPSVFQKLVSLLQELGTFNNNESSNSSNFSELVARLLAQFSSRKGRYRALETLLPLVGAQEMIAMGGGSKLMESLLEGIGDRNSHSAGTIADLWKKILTDLWQDRLLEGQAAIEGEEQGGEEDGKKKKKKPPKQFAPELVQRLLPSWWETWMPSLATALLSVTPSRRKHVASFCLPRLVSMVGGRKNRLEASRTFACLLMDIQSSARTSSSTDTKQLGGLRDRELWATLEVIRHAQLEKLVDSSSESSELVDTIKSLVSLDKLKAALIHFSPNIRLVAFQTIQPVVATYSTPEKVDGLAAIKQEIALWEEAFPYAINSDGKEYKTALLQCLTVFMDRVSNIESTSLAQQTEEVCADNTTPASGLPMLHAFVVDFLVLDVVVLRAGYPASIQEKEGFAIELLGCVIAFASRDARFVNKNVAFYERKRRPNELEAANKIMQAVLSREGLASLFCLLHSPWDGTRSSSFHLLSRLVLVAQGNDLDLAPEYTGATMRTGMMARGVYLASSPRQRESDTGARILAFLNFSLPNEGERWSHAQNLVDLLENRLTTMKDLLTSLLSGAIDPLSSEGGTRLPLAHGLIHSLRLVVEHMRQSSRQTQDSGSVERQEVCERMAQIFCLAIQVSLAVVADIKDGVDMEGMEEGLMTSAGLDGEKEMGEATPLNVNTGAIGANGTFSSIQPTEEDEHERRIAIQRIVMGSWLLTRETCAALAALLTSKLFSESHSLLDQAGSLLISTLVSLKHAGAAFAAHRALQQISEFCFNSKEPVIGNLPATWANRLLDEISAGERVRDSTLRRSTGYGLGFLAIMRSEVSSKVEPRSLCPYILKQIVRLSLPKVDEIQDYLHALNLSEAYCKSAILQLAGEDTKSEYELRSRVHALNIIRLIIMDAPLANEVSPFVGKAVVSAMMGYSDGAWTVRNSSTMVYAAVMMRSIDADKNATITDTTGTHATTIGELFKSYPLLPDFLTAILNHDTEAELKSSQLIISPIFPILLLLARVQGVSNSGSASKEMSEPFLPSVIKSLQNRNLPIRKAASRALSNLCSGSNGTSVSSLAAMLNGCHGLLIDALAGSDWNSVHGALLGINELATKFKEAGDHILSSGLLKYFQKNLVCIILKRWPPTCGSVVVQILETVSSTSKLEADWKQELGEAWDSTISHLKEAPERDAGSSELSMAAATTIRNHIATRVWDLSLSSADDALLKLVALLNSDIIDVRLYACKAFKKSIYDNVDKVVATESVRPFDRVVKLRKITSALLVVLSFELMRSGGPHPPTLRRLSRCIVECLAACDNLIQQSKNWKLAGILIGEVTRLGEDLISQDLWLSDNFTSMSGNGVEMLSFATGWNLQQSTSAVSDDQMKKVNKLVDSLSELNDSTLPWRLRHSAAVAVEHCQYLERDNTDVILNQTQQKLLEEVLTFLQDPDPDVRCSAGRAAHLMRKQNQPSDSRFSAVSQFDLEEAYQYAQKSPVSSELCSEDLDGYAANLLEGIVKRSAGMRDKLTMLRRELQNTESCSGLDMLLNVGTERKIFEDEVVNTYEEPALANQLAVHALLLLQPSEQRSSAFATAANALVDLCELVLSNIKSSLVDALVNARAGDLLHELSRSPLIFSDFHSVLVATSALVLVGGLDNKRTKEVLELAADVVSIGLPDKVHPMIKEALKMLAIAESGGGLKTIVLQCLFLLPPRMKG